MMARERPAHVGGTAGGDRDERQRPTDHDFARQWLIDHGLWDDGVGMSAEQYDLQPTSTKYRVLR